MTVIVIVGGGFAGTSVAFDWTLDLLFPRDTAELRFGEPQGERSSQEPALHS